MPTPISQLKGVAIEQAHVSFLSHIEHLPLHTGSAGAQRAARIFASLWSLQTFVKYDGSPAVVFGRDPENGRFCIGTKSVFNRTQPRRCYSLEEIAIYYPPNELGDAVGDILRHLWHATSERRYTTLFQADVLWTPEIRQIIDGMVCATPNVLTYAYPIESPYGIEWLDADLGMVVHTVYTGDTWTTLTAGPCTGNVRAQLQRINAWIASEHELNMQNIVVCEPSYSEKAWLADRQKQLEALTDQLTGSAFDLPLASLLRYEHWRIRQTPIVPRSVDDWKVFVNYESDKKSQTYLTPKGRAQEQARRNLLLAYLDRDEAAFQLWFSWVQCAEAIKDKWLKCLDRGPHLRSYVLDNGTLTKINPEGYVVWHAGLPVKLVRRDEFTRRNFLRRESEKIV